MPIERPTFHESWYRVANLHPRLRSTVQITRQHFRNQLWHVVQDHTNNAFFRLSEPAYRFVGLLDSERTVAEAWRIVSDQLGDDAPTQGEAIQLLGQLYTANLIAAEVAPDTHTLFNRYKKRRQREIKTYLMNILFARIPVWDPEAFLNRWLPLVGWVFSPVGLVVWLALMAAAFYQLNQVPGWTDKITSPIAGVLSPDNILLLYVAFAVIKFFHELGHAFSCKKFGKQSGTGGEVHTIGIMFLVFTPVPYVDASSSWALHNKWHRIIVGAAGMWVELAIASIAAMIWANTPDNSALHQFAFNIMFVASFSTVVFNANPLLRYDGYYMLSDFLEIPNLAQRGKDYIFYLVKRYVWGVKFARNPANRPSEKPWLFSYAVASFIMRIVVSVGILMYLADALEGALIILAAAMLIVAILTWVLVPIGKFIRFLASNPELSRVRGRAVITTLIFLTLTVGGLGFISIPDRARAQGVVEPVNIQEVFVQMDGFAKTVPALASPRHHSGAWQVTAGESLLTADNRELQTKLDELRAEQQRFVSKRNIALAKANDPRFGVSGTNANAPGAALGLGEAQIWQNQIDIAQQQIDYLHERLAMLNVKSPLDGLLVAPVLDHVEHAFLRQGDKIGLVASLDHLIIRAAAPNELSALLLTQANQRVEIRLKGRPDVLLTGRILQMSPAGTNKLPSAALGYQLGGSMTTTTDDREGKKTVENFFEVRIGDLQLTEAPKEILEESKQTGRLPLLPGQRVVVRFDFNKKPIATQVWTTIRQTFQKKFAG